MSLDKAKHRREELLATAPRRGNHPDDNDFAEWLGRWLQNRGRNVALMQAHIRTLKEPADRDPMLKTGILSLRAIALEDAHHYLLD
jgi:hypothetical protein